MLSRLRFDYRISKKPMTVEIYVVKENIKRKYLILENKYKA